MIYIIDKWPLTLYRDSVSEFWKMVHATPLNIWDVNEDNKIASESILYLYKLTKITIDSVYVVLNTGIPSNRCTCVNSHKRKKWPL